MKKVVGVRFKKVSKVYYFETLSEKPPKKGEKVIVETGRGVEYATVVLDEKTIDEEKFATPLKPIIRVACEEDLQRHNCNIKDANDALEVCKEKIKEHNLDMKLLESEYTFDKSKLIFYFTAEGRVDFRDLVRDLASVFRTRIELRQIGVRDEAKKLGGYGICGREFCCKKWMGDFAPVTIKMAKEQNLSLNPTKISGSCGRLFCCLKYENENYEGIIKQMPTIDSIVMTPDGTAKVIDTDILKEKVKVVFSKEDDIDFAVYDLKEINIIKRAKAAKAYDDIDENELKELED
ncbi:PSP1 domain-containing protein [Criibacterium bergeronii]|uniref:Stage 0 sporulation protein n=1 Tax=Criibacterium bergeronii TaxID=1871336 RepID=A0A371IP83_9FIRM|nr:stage 0 sporulation family protein [Criibacterium bergeronii]RDY22250.1 stage 0 sporulation protein [Criibacterium bergeronii]